MPISSADAPMLFTSAVIRMLMMLAARPRMIAIAANSSMSPCVGLTQKYPLNTVAAATPMPAVPSTQPASSVQPQNQPYCGFTIRDTQE